MSQTEIKNFIKEKRLVIGTNQTMDRLRRGEIERVFLSNKAPEKTVRDLEKYAGMAGIKLEKMNLTSYQLGILCKKQFSISVLGVLKGK